MKITVAIPCYNLEDRITACLESVISQDYQDIEILIIDDHSTDRSVEVVNNLIRRHPEREFRFIVNETNQGLNLIRNLAVREARGESLFFVDGDDTIEPGTLSSFSRRMEETHVEVVCGSYRKNDYDGNPYVIIQYPEDTIRDDFAYASYIERYIKGSIIVSVWNKLYRLDFLRSHSICCSTHYRNYEDCLFTFLVALNAPSISFIHDVTYNYCDFSSSISRQKTDSDFLQTYRAVIESVFDAKNDFEVSHKNLQVPRGISFLLNYICLTNGCLKRGLELEVSKGEKKEFLKWLRGYYSRNGINWSNVEGPYNKISYLILKSPFSYLLFRFYFRHLKTVVSIVGHLTK